MLNYVYTHFCIWKIRWWTYFLDWNKRKKSKKICGTERIHTKPEKVTKWARKSIHHDVLMWDKEIPPSDLNNFVWNSAEPRFWRIILVLGWDFLVPQQYIWRILLIPSHDPYRTRIRWIVQSSINDSNCTSVRTTYVSKLVHTMLCKFNEATVSAKHS